MNKLLDFVKSTLFTDFDITVNRSEENTSLYKIKSSCEENEATVFNYKDGSVPFLDRFTVTAKCVGDSVIFSIDMMRDDGIMTLNYLHAERAVNIKWGTDINPDSIMAIRRASPWWTFPEFADSFDKLGNRTQNAVVKIGDLHYHILPLCGDNFRCELDSKGLSISPGTSGLQGISGAFLAVTVSNDPFDAVKKGYENAHSAGAIRVPLKDERKFPEIFEGFGWCTWNTFYHDVTSEKIYKKLDEFKEKNIPVKWMIIDDGWSCVNGMLLTSFECDKEKFPEGLAACISKIKNDYGVEHVGVWHSYLGYWFGVDPESSLYEAQKENLVHTPSGVVMPAIDEERAFRFWDAWHSYLKNCGVDFLKVDNQSSFLHRASGVMPTAEGARISHRALERSVIKNFGGVMINCMGMDMENVLARPTTGVSRNSDDFFPLQERSFIPHIMQNTYNAVWHDQLYHCDYDMWWSKHEAAVQSGVLRAISGSPIYVSDAMGETDASAIFPTIENDGTVMRCDHASLPTLDCFYTDCRTSGKLLKIWNRSGDAFAAAMFNISNNDITDTLELCNIHEIDKNCDYIAYDYFEKKFTRVKAGDSIEATLAPDAVAVYNFYPVFTENGEEYIMLGNPDKYVPIASKNKVKKAVSELIN